jgi:hypothetical protein
MGKCEVGREGEGGRRKREWGQGEERSLLFFCKDPCFVLSGITIEHVPVSGYSP